MPTDFQTAMKTYRSNTRYRYPVNLNTNLIEKQQVPSEKVEALKFTHELLDFIDYLSESMSEKKIYEQKFLARMRIAIEYDQQNLWGFEQNSTFHRFFDFPKCSCPNMDNRERLGTPYKVYSQDCIIHKGF